MNAGFPSRVTSKPSKRFKANHSLRASKRRTQQHVRVQQEVHRHKEKRKSIQQRRLLKRSAFAGDGDDLENDIGVPTSDDHRESDENDLEQHASDGNDLEHDQIDEDIPEGKYPLRDFIIITISDGS
ncbi:MAG TPA: hypothetical protein VGO47_05230 [Chlamydiales bacterium]|nr:hypothetical protein [Chlamydiales bacterium]